MLFCISKAAALKRKNLWNAFFFCGFQIQQKSIIGGDDVAASTIEYEWPLSNAVSFPPEWRNQERDCWSALTPPDGNPWADIELHKQFSLLTSQSLKDLDGVVLGLLLQLIFVLFSPVLKLICSAAENETAR